MAELLDDVRLALQRGGVEYDVAGSDELRIRHGSAEVLLQLGSGGRSVISLSSDVLSRCEIGADEELGVLKALNDRNRALSFGTFFLTEAADRIVLRYDLLAEHMQDEELLHALHAVAKAADDHDDILQRELGTGLRAGDRSA